MRHSSAGRTKTRGPFAASGPNPEGHTERDWGVRSHQHSSNLARDDLQRRLDRGGTGPRSRKAPTLRTFFDTEQGRRWEGRCLGRYLAHVALGVELQRDPHRARERRLEARRDRASLRADHPPNDVAIKPVRGDIQNMDAWLRKVVRRRLPLCRELVHPRPTTPVALVACAVLPLLEHRVCTLDTCRLRIGCCPVHEVLRQKLERPASLLSVISSERVHARAVPIEKEVALFHLCKRWAYRGGSIGRRRRLGHTRGFRRQRRHRSRHATTHNSPREQQNTGGRHLRTLPPRRGRSRGTGTKGSGPVAQIPRWSSRVQQQPF